MTNKEKERLRALAKKASSRGRAFIKQVKDEAEKIVPYDGDDAYYVDEEATGVNDEPFDIPVYENVEEDIPNTEPKKTTPKQENDFVERIRVSVGGKDVESKLGSVIAKGASGIKKIVADVKTRLSTEIDEETDDVATSEDKPNTKAKVERVGEEAERIFATFTKRMGTVNESIDAKMSDIAESTRELKNNIVGTSARYEELTNELKGVAKTTTESEAKIVDMSVEIDGVKSRVDEIHSTTNSIDKLYDSVFELKATNVELRNRIDYLTKLIKVSSITTIAIVSIATIALILINLFG